MVRRRRRSGKYKSSNQNTGESTSADLSSAETESNYSFPNELVKERGWEERALERKKTCEASQLFHLCKVFDFCNKLGNAFNITPITENELEEGIMSECNSTSSDALVYFIVELFRGFTSVSSTQSIKMFQRNRIYRETNAMNFNTSLWHFLDYDWKLMHENRSHITNFLGPTKIGANFFKLPVFIRAALLADFCDYRVMCYDAQNIIDSVVDETKVPMGEQLRTSIVGKIGSHEIYYFGGIQMYRCKKLKKKELQSQEGAFLKHFTENLCVKNEMDTNEVGSSHNYSPMDTDETLDVDEKKNDIKSEDAKETGSLNESVMQSSSTDKCDPNDHQNQDFKFSYDSSQEEYLQVAYCQPESWEVIGCNENDIHYIIEYLQKYRSADEIALKEKLIRQVLPGVQKALKEAEVRKKIDHRTRFDETTPQTDFSFPANVVRSSMRLQEKKIRQEELLEEQRRSNIDLRKQLGYSIPTTSSQKLSREERLILRQQRIEQNMFDSSKQTREKAMNEEQNRGGRITGVYATNSDVLPLNPISAYQRSSATRHLPTRGHIINASYVNEETSEFKRVNPRRGENFNEYVSFDAENQQFSVPSSSKSQITSYPMRLMNMPRTRIENRRSPNTVYDSRNESSSVAIGGISAQNNSNLRQWRVNDNLGCSEGSNYPNKAYYHYPSVTKKMPFYANPLTCSTSKSIRRQYNPSQDVYPIGTPVSSLQYNRERLRRKRRFADEFEDDFPKFFSTSSNNQQSDLRVLNRECFSRDDNRDQYVNYKEKAFESGEIETGKRYVEYRYSPDEFFNILRIDFPENAKLILVADGPLRDHDYIAATAQLIIDQDWIFVTESLNPDASFVSSQFSLKIADETYPQGDEAAFVSNEGYSTETRSESLGGENFVHHAQNTQGQNVSSENVYEDFSVYKNVVDRQQQLNLPKSHQSDLDGDFVVIDEGQIAGFTDASAQNIDETYECIQRFSNNEQLPIERRSKETYFSVGSSSSRFRNPCTAEENEEIDLDL